jgi:acyl-coenzyme A synthetase/AMP-(fatty) acid ligase
LIYLGRIDHQIKIHGLRVELGEIEATLRETAGVARAVAFGWPISSNGAEGIVAFLETDEANTEFILRAVKNKLPSYMVPRALRVMSKFPLNDNGKIDRKALMELLDK